MLSQLTARSSFQVPFYCLPQIQLLVVRGNATAAPNTNEKPPFDKILVANRGEIACRVMKTCKKMGIKTVAVHSSADTYSKHVAMADEAVNIGPPPSSQSYLNIDNIVNACKKTGAQAVHPGYGFLSEKFRFVDALNKNGIVFIGPSYDSIHAMGDKIESKKLAASSGVSTIPGYKGVVENVEHAIKIAHEIGYPVMVKASGGGGGKGMRIAWKDSDVIEAYKVSKAEAMSSFGDDRLLVEKFIDNPRHIEIQILGDQFGNVVYLNERECSIQRRNQKVIEEAPSFHLDPPTRAAMGKQAVMLAKAVKYYSAGTCEFLVDQQRNFFFLEMNTRLQVEHPITELTTGVDIVEQMIKVAAGRPLDIKQEDIKIKGWAFESRVYAEDPVKYLPSIGRLNTYIEPPADDPNIRCDSGILEGSEISIYYDPLISKLCTHGNNRHEALEKMKYALDTYVIKGVTHNIPLLREVFSNPRFAAGRLSTKFLPEEYPEGFRGKKLEGEVLEQFLATAGMVHVNIQRNKASWVDANVIGTNFSNKQDIVISVIGKSYPITLESNASGNQVNVTYNGKKIALKTEWPLYSHLIHLNIDGKQQLFQYLDPLPEGFVLQLYGSKFDVTVRTPEQQNAAKYMKEKPKLDHAKFTLSPMPGNVVSVAVQAGDVVAEGQELAIIEAMKMQNVLHAEKVGKVKAVHVKPGQSVEGQQILIEFEDEAKEEKKK